MFTTSYVYINDQRMMVAALRLDDPHLASRACVSVVSLRSNHCPGRSRRKPFVHCEALVVWLSSVQASANAPCTAVIQATPPPC